MYQHWQRAQKKGIGPLNCRTLHLEAAFSGALVFGLAVISGYGQVDKTSIVGPQADGSYVVASGQRLTPAGQQIPVQGRLYDVALDPAGKFAAVKVSSSLVMIDVEKGQAVQVLALEKAKTSAVLSSLGMQSFTGLAWNPDGSEVYSTDATSSIRVARFISVPIDQDLGRFGESPLLALERRSR